MTWLKNPFQLFSDWNHFIWKCHVKCQSLHTHSQVLDSQPLPANLPSPTGPNLWHSLPKYSFPAKVIWLRPSSHGQVFLAQSISLAIGSLPISTGLWHRQSLDQSLAQPANFCTGIHPSSLWLSLPSLAHQSFTQPNSWHGHSAQSANICGTACQVHLADCHIGADSHSAKIGTACQYPWQGLPSLNDYHSVNLAQPIVPTHAHAKSNTINTSTLPFTISHTKMKIVQYVNKSVKQRLNLSRS